MESAAGGSNVMTGKEEKERKTIDQLIVGMEKTIEWIKRKKSKKKAGGST
jgi:hypothetical protein